MAYTLPAFTSAEYYAEAETLLSPAPRIVKTTNFPPRYSIYNNGNSKYFVTTPTGTRAWSTLPIADGYVKVGFSFAAATVVAYMLNNPT